MDEELKKNLEEIKQKIENQEIVQAAEHQMAENCLKLLEQAIADLRAAKPEERNERARRYAVTITDLEKVIAYFKVYIVDEH